MPRLSRWFGLSLAGAILAPSLVAQNAATPMQSVARSSSGGAGRPIAPTDIKNWNSIRQNALSNDGKWFAYTVGAAESDLTLVLRSTAPGAVETRVPVGATGGSIQMSGDSKWMGYLITPNRPATGAAGRGGRGGGGGGAGGRAGGAADTVATPAANASRLVLMNLASGEKKEFNGIRRFSFNSEDKPTWLVMQAGGAAAPAPGGGGRGGPVDLFGGSGGGTAGGNADLMLYNLATGERQNMG
ncbi:MAG: hypothetical protein H7Z40_16750, partial [Phycisphaerae bacterium]|nr:hypothetical protein [Gemmatimonadaceae bacterium]